MAILAIMASPLNTGWFDVSLQWTGIVLSASLLFVLYYTNAAWRLNLIKLFLAFGLFTTLILAYMLKHTPAIEYAHVYWITQSLSYLIETSICIQFANSVITNNWYVTAIFAPFLTVVAGVNCLVYGIPKGLSDVNHQAYIATLICAFILVVVWLLQGRFEGRLEQPYSGIVFMFACYIGARFCINYIHGYFGKAHWEIISRLTPINEIVLLIGWLAVILYYYPSATLKESKDRSNDSRYFI